MRVIEHSFFEVLYIDPDEGCYWNREFFIHDAPCRVAVYIEDPKMVTPQTLATAQQYIEIREELTDKAQAALEEHLLNKPLGVCAKYIHKHINMADFTKDDDNPFFSSALHECAYSLVQSMFPSLISIYPTDTLLPIVIDFTIGEDITDEVISVTFSTDGEIASIEATLHS